MLHDYIPCIVKSIMTTPFFNSYVLSNLIHEVIIIFLVFLVFLLAIKLKGSEK